MPLGLYFEIPHDLRINYVGVVFPLLSEANLDRLVSGSAYYHLLPRRTGKTARSTLA
jgi:hypothetical protein